MLSRSHSYALLGIEAIPVEVEVDAGGGLPNLTIVGLPDQAVKEARERVRSALLNSGFELPAGRLTVNLAPADLKKQGGSFDLAIALGLLASSGQAPADRLDLLAAIGELALDGSVRPAPGVLPIALAARRHDRRTLLVPAMNMAEAALVDGICAIGVSRLQEAVDYLRDAWRPTSIPPDPRHDAIPPFDVDFSDVKGQPFAKRALDIATA